MEKQTEKPRKVVFAPVPVKAGDLRQFLANATDQQKVWIERTLENNPDGQTVYADREMMNSLTLAKGQDEEIS